MQAQSIDEWEAVVVDDASTVELGVEEFHDPRIRYVRRTHNGGVAAAQNTGLDHVTGRYVAFLHSDDELLDDSLQRRVEVLDGAPADIGGVECGHEELYPDGNTLAHRPYLDGANDVDVLAYRAGVHISKLLLRREVAASVRFDESLRGAEDRDFAIRLLRCTRLAILNEPLVRIERMAEGLRSQPKGAIYEYLLHKYATEISADPSLERSWWFRVARAYARSGAIQHSRTTLRRAIRAQPTRVRLWPLDVATYLGDRVFSTSMRVYLRATDH